MRYRRKHVGFHPFAVRQHSLLVAARTEIPRLAREGQDGAMPAMGAVDPSEPVPRIAACEKPFDDTFLDMTSEPAARLQLGRMPGGTLIQRRRAQIARPVDPAAWRNGVSTAHPASNAPGGAARASRAGLEDMANER